ncbi:VOC family protein [Bifidobacterium sp. 82T24]|uniref:VOC family protein n=1 Tax=Bifidobacterium pluvialisilvae TaxID=2834436 RepID=UPI001C576351|nr:VOC family protein [Bifidobacterium pluvialisilvae]MBW3087312.1 VOC family protein [Bifidobacterium pluvialisilvae]
MIDHLTIKVKDFDREAAFYEAALAPLGYAKGAEFPGAVQFAAADGSSVWVSRTDGETAPVHVAFGTKDEEAVKAFHKAGLAAGGTDNGEPGPRPNYGPTYYAAFVHDPEGNNIEACIH